MHARLMKVRLRDDIPVVEKGHAARLRRGFEGKQGHSLNQSVCEKYGAPVSYSEDGPCANFGVFSPTGIGASISFSSGGSGHAYSGLYTQVGL